ncbi:hypothetical protein GCM10027256_13650 [Novispirillum itersonii subsp. nipponicum]|uniref:Putative membrane protein n=2 Tax=Novispirillum itersonii TaxID=189 RepID=A0A7X0DNN0_NOVIT|nr:putative membrane protein [Novispirillum itersonii]
MLRHSRVHALLDQWSADGLIAPEHLPRLRSDLDSAGRLARPVTVLAVVAVLLLLAAALSFLASNWEEMPRLLRLGLICATVGGSGTVAVLRWRTVPAAEIGRDLPAQMALVLCAGLFGVGLLLVSQMFHFGGDLTGFMAVWGLATLLLALVAGTARLTLTLAVVLLSGWGLAPLAGDGFSGMAMGWNALFAPALAVALVTALKRGWALELWLGHLGLWLWLYVSVIGDAPALRFLGGDEAFMLLPVLHGVLWAALLTVPPPEAGQTRGWRWAAARLAEAQQVAALCIPAGLIQAWLNDWVRLTPPVGLVSVLIVLAVAAGALLVVQTLRRRALSGDGLLATAVAVLPVLLSGEMQRHAADAGDLAVWGILGLGLALTAGFLGLGVARGRRGLTGLAVLAFLALTFTGIGMTGLGALFFLIVGGGLAVLAVILARRSRSRTTATDAGERA